jgi:hypothetical protein
MSNFLLRTEIEIQELVSKIKYSDKILSLGSCFSVEMAEKLKSLQYQVLQNPAGITFNPKSIASTVKTIISANSLPDKSLVYLNGIWSHDDFHGSFNGADKAKVLANIDSSIQNAHDFIKNLKFVFITIGTAFVFEKIASQKVVNNCHKQPSSHFNRKLLSSSEIHQSLIEMKSNLDAYSTKDIQYILTLSPVRHIRDGIQANQRSKSTALVAIHDFVENSENVHYFPSYEIMIDDLRDYRFYKDDFIHPNNLALQYIYNKFEDFALSNSESSLRKKIANIVNREHHKALFPDSAAHKKFLTQLKIDKAEMKNEFDWMWSV